MSRGNKTSALFRVDLCFVLENKPAANYEFYRFIVRMQLFTSHLQSVKFIITSSNPEAKGVDSYFCNTDIVFDGGGHN